MKIVILALAACTVAAPAFAQIPVGTRTGDTGGGYERGGRDPFIALVTPKRPALNRPEPLPTTRRRTGLATLSLADVQVRGVVRVGDRMMAVIEGPDKVSFTARPDDALLDATVKTIDSLGVVFLVRVGDAAPQEIRKTLRSAAEVIR